MSEQLGPLATAIATVVVALIGGGAGYLTAGWKVRELRVAHAQKLRDSYLENARKVAGEVYIPLAIVLAELSRSYSEFRVHVDFQASTAPVGAINRFKAACGRFDSTYSELLSRGASAYLTLHLEEELQDFALFLRGSVEAESITRKATLSPKFAGVAYSEIQVQGARSIAMLRVLERASAGIIRTLVPFRLVELSVTEETLASPVTSRDFEQRFQRSTLPMGVLIKEVTLGSRSG
ncbi:MAG: hypothetical protein AVDCRST_MAG93-8887 [uncultured Chloroflexia bacterium]|uniref:Uncharacterized protein n=1 Tax=uncultured Chloroflexia bacterium TaxID=1672391 RepID=A0A6J4N8B8_9CHLR|nr:MAG: hypothetical protein AVDCRST_MAG93-8887 [uncultured Chloroflexia bacterium]